MWSEQDTAELLTHEKGGVRPIGILNLAKLAPLFRDESAYDQFIVTMMQMIASNELIIVATNDNVIATMRSAIDVREAFQWRISSRLAEDPHAEVMGQGRSVPRASMAPSRTKALLKLKKGANYVSC
jgi:hypothetical protein